MSATRPLHELSIAEAGRQLRAGTLSSTTLTQHALSRIASLDPLLHAFVLVTKERALADAERADRELKSGIDKGPMHGIPYALKDIYATAGIRTTCHSKLLIDNVPVEDSVVEAKFKAGGAVLLGKLATHEFAIGGPSFDLPFPPARNPWNLDHFTGGSSSGSGAAVAAGLVRMAMGSDTGGSIRGPAFYCGTVGIKPTYGLVSRRGVFPLSYTLDHCGPLRLDGGGRGAHHAGDRRPRSARPCQRRPSRARLHRRSRPRSGGPEARLSALVLRDAGRHLAGGHRVARCGRPAARQARRQGRGDHASRLRAVQRLRPHHPDRGGLRHPRAGPAEPAARLRPLHLSAHDARSDDLRRRPDAGLPAAARAGGGRQRQGPRHLRCHRHGERTDPGAALRRVPGRRAAEDDAADHAVQRAPAIRRWRSRPGSPRAGCRSACRSSAARSTSRPCSASAPPTRRRRAGSTSARRSRLRSQRDAQHLSASRLPAHPPTVRSDR